ncbi:hypothetical protein KUTeg_004785 [Tegillarca granosa]|uniref:Uncharacterized protein n=1 Tax=Tegillarca granosa TaxID=220873 RepID=A0ABQ9FHV4_TEGGR|nr:hypothetical protein KUTeg_004785 [Tegillarca granosa]
MDLIIQIFLLLIFVNICGGTDPELTSETLTDSVGNSADVNSKVSFADLPTASYLASNDTYSETGVEWWYNFVNFFIVDIVFPKGFPSSTIAKYLDGSLITELTTKYNGLVVFGEFGGYVIFLLIGFFFIFIFPLIGCCFCCCRCCCGNCGGDMMQKKEDAENNCKRRTFQVKQIGKTNFNFTQDVINRDLDSIGYIIGIPVRTTITDDSGIEAAMSSVLSLGDKITDISNAMSALNTQVDECKTAVGDFSSAMTSLTDYISQTNTDCQNNNAACAALTLPNTASYSVKIDTDSAKKDLIDIPWRVQNETTSTVQKCKRQSSRPSQGSCEADKGSFEALKFDSQINMTSLTDFKSNLDIDSKTNDINIDLSTVSILTDDLLTNLEDLKTAVDIDFNAFYDQDLEVKVYAQRIVTTVEYFINDTIYANGFWFAIGWCIFFFLPSIIFATKLAKHYKRMSRLDEPEKPEKEPLPEDNVVEEEDEEDTELKVLENQNSFYKRLINKKGFQDPLRRMARLGNNKVWHSVSPPPYSEKPTSSKSRSTSV